MSPWPAHTWNCSFSNNIFWSCTNDNNSVKYGSTSSIERSKSWEKDRGFFLRNQRPRRFKSYIVRILTNTQFHYLRCILKRLLGPWIARVDWLFFHFALAWLACYVLSKFWTILTLLSCAVRQCRRENWSRGLCASPGSNCKGMSYRWV